MSRRITNKQLLLMILLAAVLAFSAGGTVAFIMAKTDKIDNTFEPARVSCEVQESFNGNTKTDVAIENTSDIDAYIRAEVIITWQNENGEVYGQMPAAGTDYAIDYGDIGTGISPKWVEGNDGFYYWTGCVVPDGSTENLIDSVVPNEGAAPEGYSLCVEIIGSAVQADGGSAVGESAEWTPAVVQAWDNDKIDITVEENGTLTVTDNNQ